MRTLSLSSTGKLLGLLIVTTFALAACGDDGGSDENSNNGGTSTNNATTSTNTGTTSTNTGTTSTNGGTTSTNNSSTGTNNSTTSTNNASTGTNNSTTSTNNNTNGSVLRENVDEAEIGNTLADLDAIPLIDLGNTNFDAIEGNIGDTWTATAPDGTTVTIGDVDWYAFQAPPRSTVSFTVEPTTPDGPYRPLVYTHDSFKFLTLGFDEAVATTDVIYPYIAGTIGMYLFISDITNEENFENNGPYVGGPGHDYRITWDITPFAPVELGDGLTPGMSVSAPAAPLEEGEMRIYRFTTSGEGVPSVTFQASGSEEWFPEVLPLTTVGGQAVYEVVACEGELSRTIGWDDPELVEVLDGGNKEYLVALFDCNGKGGSDYTFTLDVNVD